MFSTELVGSPPPDALGEAARIVNEHRISVWVTGIVAVEPLDHPNQGQGFGNWAQSKLGYAVGVGDKPPAGHKQPEYRTIRSHYPSPNEPLYW